MKASRFASSILVSFALSSPWSALAVEDAGNVPAVAGLGQAQDAVANAAGVMDGVAKRSGLNADLAVDAGLSKEADPDAAAKAVAQAKAEPGQKGAGIDSGKVPAPPAGNRRTDLLAGAKKKLRGVYKWMLRNPVEVSFMVGIPVTFLAGPRAGMMAGAAVYYALYFLQQRHKPF